MPPSSGFAAKPDGAGKGSFVVSQILVKKVRPFTDGKLIKECMVIVSELMIP